jgi:hypothetical protein
MSARLWPSTLYRMPGSGLRTRALHWRSSVPETLSSRSAQPICSPSCSTTTLAKCPSARSHPICVSWRPGPMRPNLRSHLTVSPEPIHVPLSSRCVHLTIRPHVAQAGQRRPCDNVAPRDPCALVRCPQTARPPRSRVQHQLASRNAHHSSPGHRRAPSWLPYIHWCHVTSTRVRHAPAEPSSPAHTARLHQKPSPPSPTSSRLRCNSRTAARPILPPLPTSITPSRHNETSPSHPHSFPLFITADQ